MIPLLSALMLMIGGAVGGNTPAQGWIEGRTVGEALAPVPGVLVEVSGGRLDAPVRGVTDGEGRFRLGPLPAGSGYRIRAVHLGYHVAALEDVRVADGETLEVELRLARQTMALDTIRAFGSPLRIRRADTEFTTRIDARAIELLPTAHEPSDLVALTPGARPGQIWGGAEARANVYQMDGLAQTHPGTGGAIIEPSMRWVERVEVRGLGAAAEHGGFQGGLVNVVTRSGSNIPTGGFRVNLEAHPLNATNLNREELGLETELRREIEGDASGPILRDRLYYFVGAHALQENRRAQGHLVPHSDARFLPWTRDRQELRGFAKLRWEPSYRDRIDLTGGWIETRVDNATLRGYETSAAAGALESPNRFYTLQWDRGIGGGVLEASLAGFATDERLSGGRGADVPGTRIFAHGEPPMPAYQNIPMTRRRSTSSTGATLAWAVPLRLAGWEHRIRIGAESSLARFDDRTERSGGMTWRPYLRTFEPDDPSTWYAQSVVPVERGGTVDLHSRIRSTAIFLQDHITLSPHLSISPGVRMGFWRGELLPGGDASRRYTALTASGMDPRIGITIDPAGTNRIVFKGHWGRFHQGMLTSFFDREQGGGVFQNRERWYYSGPPPTDPSQGFDPASFGGPDFPLERGPVFRTNEVGRVDPEYRHPHVDQWIAGIEGSPNERIRLELLYVNRVNRNMVALVDRNMADNYHVYRNVRITGPEGSEIELDGEPFVIPEVYVPYDVIRHFMESYIAAGPGEVWPPGFVPADLEWLSYDQDLWLTNPPEATRRFHQIQFVADVSYPRWGASLSGVWTRLRGNLNSVTSYEAGTSFEDVVELGAGPFVRPNEQVNFMGALPGYSPLELKLAIHGEVGWGVRAGGFLNFARGDRFTAHFPLYSPGTEAYTEDGQLIQQPIFHTIAGQRVLVQERGSARYDDRKSLDLRLDRTLPLMASRVRVTLDVFNIWNDGAVTRIIEESNPGTTLAAHSRFGSVLERVPPRTFRIGLTADF